MAVGELPAAGGNGCRDARCRHVPVVAHHHSCVDVAEHVSHELQRHTVGRQHAARCVTQRARVGLSTPHRRPSAATSRRRFRDSFGVPAAVVNTSPALSAGHSPCTSRSTACRRRCSRSSSTSSALGLCRFGARSDSHRASRSATVIRRAVRSAPASACRRSSRSRSAASASVAAVTCTRCRLPSGPAPRSGGPTQRCFDSNP